MGFRLLKTTDGHFKPLVKAEEMTYCLNEPLTAFLQYGTKVKLREMFPTCLSR